MKYCKCIEDGYLNDGDIFCREGEIYRYRVKEGYQKYPISVSDIATKDHQMDWPFFNMFFLSIEKDEFLNEKEMEV